MGRKQKTIWTSAIFGAFLLIGFQNCSHPSHFSGTSTQSSSDQNASGNGDSYGGKPTVFNNSDNSNPCPQKDRDGRPLPNSQILYYTQTHDAKLVRDECTDMAAQPVAKVALANDGSGDLVIGALRYQTQKLSSDFSVVAASCPVGLAPKAGAVRTNLVPNAQDMTDTSTWWNHTGIVSLWNGVIASLPAFLIERNDASQLDYWRRAHYAGQIDASTPYVFSYLGQPGTVSQSFFSLTDSTGSIALSIIFDLNTGTSTVQQNAGGFSGVSVTSQVVSGARYFSVYFTAPTSISNAVIGITPNGLTSTNVQDSRVGDSIVVSMLQLEKIASFCGP